VRTVPPAIAAPQFARYAIVGALNTAVSIGAYSVLVAAASPYVIASGIGFLLGATTSYLGNRAWTFAATTTSHGSAAPRYLGVMLLGLASDLVLIALLVDGLGVAKVPAQLLVTPAVAVQGYLLSRHWAFAGGDAAAWRPWRWRSSAPSPSRPRAQA
jgi:putative flippase GtrA